MCVGKKTQALKRYVQHSKYGFCLKLEAITGQINKSCGTAGLLTDEENAGPNMYGQGTTHNEKYRICTYSQWYTRITQSTAAGNHGRRLWEGAETGHAVTETARQTQNSWAESSDESGVTACHWAVTRSRDTQLGSAAVLERWRCSDEDRNGVCRSQARCTAA